MTGTVTKADMLRIPCQEISAAGLVDAPLVSVLMMTRNHAAYIEQALESILSQKCSFKFEILVGEDFSEDDTRAICETLQEAYPDHVRLMVAERNVGITANFLRLVSRARGKYCAFLEGDDYWTSEDKLQRQVDLLDVHPEYSWCGAGTRNRTKWLPVKPSYTLEEVLRRYVVHTSTAVFRTEHLQTYPDFPDAVCWESMLFAYLSQFGQCGYLNVEVSYYRRHAGGLWHASQFQDRIRMTRICIDALREYFGSRYSRELADREIWIYQMDTANSWGGGYMSRWRRSLAMCPSAVSRLFRYAPLRACGLALRILFQPIAVMAATVRMRLALGVRTRNLVEWSKVKIRGK